MPRRFTKIKFDGTTVELHYEEGDNFTDKYTMKCNELPRPEMTKAFDDMREEARLLCELPPDYLQRIEVRSVTLNYSGKQETMGATISARMKLEYSNAPLILNTPNKPVQPYQEGYYDEETLEKMCLRGQCTGKLAKLIDEAHYYVDGIRAQGNLFEDQKMVAV